MARKVTVETYLDRETVEQIDAQTDNRAAYIRTAVKERLRDEP